NDRNRLRVYPGSPALARAWLRAQDRLIACELEPKASASLSRNLQGDARIKTLRIDGWTAMNAYVPPRERRGLVLVDPSFETDSDFPRLASGLAAAHRKWATGVYFLWYPIKVRRPADVLAKQVRRLAIRALRVELLIGAPSDQNRLKGAGLLVVNPPWTLENELSALLPALSAILGTEGKGGFRLDWLAGSPRATAAPWPLSTAPQLVCSSHIGSDVPPPVGAGGVTEADLRLTPSPIVNVRPSRRAWGRRRSRWGKGGSRWRRRAW